MSLSKRKLSYGLAINEALCQIMEKDMSVFLLGQGVKSPWYVGATCKDLLDKFGENRVIDTPISENAMTGTAVGAALIGMRPVAVYPRMDFMIYAFDPIINEAANWHYMSGGKSCAPVVFWGIINRGGEQAAQHSQALQSLFAHIPGLKVVAPSTPYDAKGLMLAAIKDDNPVIYIDDRWLYGVEGDVPEEIYAVPIGKGIVRKQGKDVTIVAASYMAQEAIKANEFLEKQGISAEIIDLRSLKPIDEELLFESVKKTGKLVIADGTWKSYGVSAEISALVSENIFKYLKAPVQRVALPDCPAPANQVLEKAYYPTKDNIIEAVKKII
ncbi:alpha-ketoacid dehydrogenase subunit beta [Candidatus Parcubacteria bacterium]|nr:alpha-ketoacid dehydrogenase subunit beta [Candidatus Parcubacteria bacterium]